MVRFLYFDLGNVLVHFSVDRMLRQVAAVAKIEPERVGEAVFRDGLQTEFETGRITPRQFYERFCEQTGVRPEYDALERAASDIFEVNVTMLPVLARLARAGWPMGILSNTCQTHWEHCHKRFTILPSLFGTYALSYQIGAMKPEATIFLAAAELAGCSPDEIVYVDDLAQHVEGARALGLDAVQYTGTPRLAAELRRRGL
ncbi:MAG: HAD family phosphatase [Patescibacteria group bacterium]|nr:HAD family phosphatase [Patescibacteria group bacterium]